jgi:HlyD family secretion protein
MKSVLLFLALVVVLAAGGGAFYGYFDRGSEQAAFRLGRVERGDLVVTVGATGTLEPEEVVDVGAQVVGRIKEFGADPRGATDPAFKDKRVDYGATVEEGTVLALIDDAVYVAERSQAKAALERAKADLAQLEAHLMQAEAEWERAQRLRDLSVQGDAVNDGSLKAENSRPHIQIHAISDSDYILAKSNYEVAKANIEVGKAAIAQQQSALDLAETNLSYTVIKSPVRGTIIDRRVNIGQTVVASLNAPSLFLIAKDLRRMQVWASVNEADIGDLKVGTPVTFTVDAFPKDEFKGEVVQVRLNAKMTQNVVTYTVVIATDNSDLKLLPYLTADVKFETQRRNGVLSVPNAALRYEPRPELVAGKADAGQYAEPDVHPSAVPGEQATLWVQNGSRLSPLRVTVGVTDGTRTEVSGDGLADGQEVVLGELQAGETPEVNNPFAPSFRRPQKKPSS